MAERDWLRIARGTIGVREFPGPANNPVIMAWANRIGSRVLGIAYPGDATPWCGLWMAWVMAEAGFRPPAISIRAKSWANWGQKVTAPLVGAVAVFSRQGGGHVGLIVGHDATHLHILGGNQSDGVNVMRLARARCIAMRWPPGVAVVGAVRSLASAGVAVSTNEA